MKALSLKQPWAELILRGVKTIEVRTWRTTPKKFYIHASKTQDLNAMQGFNIPPNSLPLGQIVGKAEIIQVKRYENNEEFFQDSDKHLATPENIFQHTKSKIKYGFVLDKVKRIKPLPYRGMLGFFDVEDLR